MNTGNRFSAAVLGLLLGACSPAFAAQVLWQFDTPGIANATAGEVVATMTLTDTTGGVRFVLDPNESNAGFTTSSFLDQVFFIYNPGPTLTGGTVTAMNTAVGSFTWTAGTGISSFSLPNGTTEDGYSPLRIQVAFPTDKNGDRFLKDDTTTFTISGVTTANFAEPYADANSPNKPQPIAGIVSVDGFTGNTSNWVAMAPLAPIPEPSQWAMLLAGLFVVGAIARRRIESLQRSVAFPTRTLDAAAA